MSEVEEKKLLEITNFTPNDTEYLRKPWIRKRKTSEKIILDCKSRLNEKHYQKELFKYKLKHWFESMNTLRLANYMDVGLTEVKEDGVIECAMDRYADSLFEYLEKCLKLSLKMIFAILDANDFQLHQSSPMPRGL